MLTIDMVEQFVATPLVCYKCHKMGNMRRNIMEKVSVENGGENNLTPPEMNTQSHTNVQTVVQITQYMQEAVKNENEILTVKYTRNILFLEAQAMVEATNKGKNVKTVSSTTNRQEKHKTLVQ